MPALDGNRRAVSPVIGTILLVAIVVVLAALSAAILLDLTGETDPQPNVILDGERTNAFEPLLVHDGGETLDGDRLELQGVADPEAAAGRTLADGDAVPIYPTEEEVTVVWFGDNDESYVLGRISIENPLPEPDEGCDWVEDETNGGTEQAKIDGIVVNCAVKTEERIEIQNDGVIIGDAMSQLKELDADDARIHGDVSVEKVLNLQDGRITGTASSSSEDVKLNNATVGGATTAQKIVELTGGSTVKGDIESKTKDVKVLDGSLVEDSVTADGLVKVEDSEIRGHVYTDPADFQCTNSVINGEDCDSYTPKDPS